MTEIHFYRADREHGYLSNLYRCSVLLANHAFEDDASRRAIHVCTCDTSYAACPSHPAERIEFRSAEDGYQFAKPRSRAVAAWLIAAPAPHLTAVAAHALLGFDMRGDWRTFKLERMRAVLRAKFTQHPDLTLRLLDTGDATLIEDSKTDLFWGVGPKGLGQNMLGRMLMELRGELRSG